MCVCVCVCVRACGRARGLFIGGKGRKGATNQLRRRGRANGLRGTAATLTTNNSDSANARALPSPLRCLLPVTTATALPYRPTTNRPTDRARSPAVTVRPRSLGPLSLSLSLQLCTVRAAQTFLRAKPPSIAPIPPTALGLATATAWTLDVEVFFPSPSCVCMLLEFRFCFPRPAEHLVHVLATRTRSTGRSRFPPPLIERRSLRRRPPPLSEKKRVLLAEERTAPLCARTISRQPSIAGQREMERANERTKEESLGAAAVAFKRPNRLGVRLRCSCERAKSRCPPFYVLIDSLMGSSRPVMTTATADAGAF